MALVVIFGKKVEIMFKKINYDTDKIYNIKPSNLSSTFIRLLHLLTDEDILLTFKERDELYKHMNFIIKFLEAKDGKDD